MNGVGERLFKVDHETNWSVKNGQVLLFGDVFNEVQEVGVHCLCFPSYQTIKDRVRHAIFQESMEHIQLGVGENDAGERSVSLYQRCCSEEFERAFQAKDNDVLSVIAQYVVRFLFDHIFDVNGDPPLEFLSDDDVAE